MSQNACAPAELDEAGRIGRSDDQEVSNRILEPFIPAVERNETVQFGQKSLG
jgi:hypothetical protein